MADTKSEMSLDEVLSSIKKMVVDTEPPVLDLTDMITEDGSVVKVGEKNPSDSMGDFLRLAQQDEEHEHKENATSKKVQRTESDKKVENHNKSDKEAIMLDIFKELAAPEVKKWLDAHLSDVVSEIANQTMHKWIQENLSSLVGRIVEREIRSLLNRKSN